MTSRNRRWERTRAPATDIPVGDDVDPDYYFDPQPTHDRHRERQSARVCAVALRVASDVLQAEVSDPLLQSLSVVGVDPAPDASRLAILVESSEPIPPDTLQERLRRAAGLVRTALAQSLQRKRTPQLVFVVVPAGRGEP